MGHVEDQGIRHAYIRRGTPQLNGKVERSHRSDSQEFYQLLSYKGDVDLEVKLNEWERFYNFARPHGAFNGKTPYEALREKLKSSKEMSRNYPQLTHRTALSFELTTAFRFQYRKYEPDRPGVSSESPDRA
jgi:hypothetical protein